MSAPVSMSSAPNSAEQMKAVTSVHNKNRTERNCSRFNLKFLIRKNNFLKKCPKFDFFSQSYTQVLH